MAPRAPVLDGPGLPETRPRVRPAHMLLMCRTFHGWSGQLNWHHPQGYSGRATEATRLGGDTEK
ncbi:hypothetical protein BGK67_32670 [Streptomyces subrutilus]|uniref:Uncharacterized protein n=1 Tax=Streptomyces subrutilus TaxID=36818 RepID=A0A1E5NZS8_9ACTN|nr:hypothetical protein BGK67_32670 [Streptomyces subrutilus]